MSGLCSLYGQVTDTTIKKLDLQNQINSSYQNVDKAGNAVIVEMTEEIPGEIDSLVKIIVNRLVYPQTAIRDGVQGKVKTRFSFDLNGNVKDVTVVKGVRQDLDSVCYYAISNLPPCEPKSTFSKKFKKITFLLPITFKLGNSK